MNADESQKMRWDLKRYGLLVKAQLLCANAGVDINYAMDHLEAMEMIDGDLYSDMLDLLRRTNNVCRQCQLKIEKLGSEIAPVVKEEEE